MKLLTNEQQTDLQKVFEELLTMNLIVAGGSRELPNQIAYWAIELKPKRVRRVVRVSGDSDNGGSNY